MFVIFLMARNAFLRSITPFFTRHMALLTGHRGVLAGQRVVGFQRVLKLRVIEFRGVTVTAFVVGVACAAHHRLRNPTMKTLVRLDVASNVLVTRHAQAVLGLAIQLDVALLAIVFVLGVPLYQFARCHDGLQSLRACRHGKQQGQ